MPNITQPPAGWAACQRCGLRFAPLPLTLCRACFAAVYPSDPHSGGSPLVMLWDRAAARQAQAGHPEPTHVMTGQEPRPGQVTLRVIMTTGHEVTLPLSYRLIRRVEPIDQEHCHVWLTKRAAWTVVGSADTIRAAIAAAQAEKEAQL